MRWEVKVKKSNQQVLDLLNEVDQICVQLNSMSYNNKDHRELMEKHENKLDLIHKDLSGDASAQRTLTKMPKVCLQ